MYDSNWFKKYTLEETDFFSYFELWSFIVCDYHQPSYKNFTNVPSQTKKLIVNKCNNTNAASRASLGTKINTFYMEIN